MTFEGYRTVVDYSTGLYNLMDAGRLVEMGCDADQNNRRCSLSGEIGCAVGACCVRGYYKMVTSERGFGGLVAGCWSYAKSFALRIYWRVELYVESWQIVSRCCI